MKRKKKQSANSSPPPKISYIVSAYNRPTYLQACLATLALQTEPSETIVCINSTEDWMVSPNIEICKRFGVQFLLTGRMGAKCCYSSAEIAIKQAKGEWVCFPSDDSLYVPCFADLMMRAAREQEIDLVYCDCVYDPMRIIGIFGRYGLLSTRPQPNCIDKTIFMVKRKWFNGFPGKRIEGPSGADHLLIEDLLRRGIKHGKAEGILAVHN